jgi:hypothetical protein
MRFAKTDWKKKKFLPWQSILKNFAPYISSSVDMIRICLKLLRASKCKSSGSFWYLSFSPTQAGPKLYTIVDHRCSKW